MPTVHRTVESVNTDISYSWIPVALEQKQDLRKHLFSVPDAVKEEILVDATLRIERKKRFVEVTVRNEIPHSIPGGGFGKRELHLRLHTEMWSMEQVLNRALDEKIPAAEARSFRFEIPKDLDVTQLELTIERWNRLENKSTILLKKNLFAAGASSTP